MITSEIRETTSKYYGTKVSKLYTAGKPGKTMGVKLYSNDYCEVEKTDTGEYDQEMYKLENLNIE